MTFGTPLRRNLSQSTRPYDERSLNVKNDVGGTNLRMGVDGSVVHPVISSVDTSAAVAVTVTGESTDSTTTKSAIVAANTSNDGFKEEGFMISSGVDTDASSGTGTDNTRDGSIADKQQQNPRSRFEPSALSDATAAVTAANCLNDVKSIVVGESDYDDVEKGRKDEVLKGLKKHSSSMTEEDEVLRPTASLQPPPVGVGVVDSTTEARALAAEDAAGTTASGKDHNPSTADNNPAAMTVDDIQNNFCHSRAVIEGGSSATSGNAFDCCDSLCGKESNVVMEEENEEETSAATHDFTGAEDSKYIMSSMTMLQLGEDGQARAHRLVRHTEQFRDEDVASSTTGGTRDVILAYGIPRNNMTTGASPSTRNGSRSSSHGIMSRFRSMFTGSGRRSNNNDRTTDDGKHGKDQSNNNANEDTFIVDDGIVLDSDHGRSRDQNSLRGNSIIDTETVVCDNDNEDSIGRCTVKRDPHQFRWIVAMCCIIHIILVALVIGFAVYSRQDVEGSSASNNNNNNNNSGDGGAYEDLSTPAPSVEATVEDTVGQTTVIETISPTVGGTISPTAEDTLSPTIVETNEPTCTNSLEVSASCFSTDAGEDILTFFRSCTPQAGDWIGVFEASGQPSNLSVRVSETDAIDWLFTCGDQECQDPVLQEVVPFQQLNGQYVAGTSYQVHMFRDGDGPFFSSFASSPAFQIVQDAADCTF